MWAGLEVKLFVKAPAKINLHLQVIGRRPDGFHEVRTLLQSIDLADRLEVELAPPGCLEMVVRPAGSAPVDASNLVLRAAQALLARTGVKAGAQFVLEKRIPVGGGLGGGSADAAAALVALNTLWDLGLSRVQLAAVGADLGSDIPFFLSAGLALGVGRGEEIYPLADLPKLGVVVAVPAGALEIPTKDVYGRLKPPLTWAGCEASVYAFAAGFVAEPMWDKMSNDLESVVLQGWPEVAGVVNGLRRLGALRAGVTGSGAASFGLFPSAEEAAAAAATLDSESTIFVGTTLDRTSAALEVVELD